VLKGKVAMEDADLPSGRALLLSGREVGLAVMLAEDVPLIARWNQDLDFTARLGTPGEVHSLEMRQEFFAENGRIGATSAEFAVIECASGRLVGFGGLFDISRALTATLFVGIGDAADRGRGRGREASRLICEYGFFFRSLHSIKVEVHAWNRPALRAYAGLGFREVGRLRGANLLNGQRHDEVILDLLRDEFQPQHLGGFVGLSGN
jgi:RimJ/RimL family protein N-acetyltransferase